MKMSRNITQLITSTILLIPLTLNFSCSLFDNDVGDFMEKYTETAAVEEHTFSVPTYSDSNKNDCINSKQDFEVELYLRNPKKFSMQPSVQFKNLPDTIDVSSVTIEQTSFNSLKLFLSQEFLLTVDEGHDITASIDLYEPMSGRVFTGYDIPLSCNTIPPQIQNATILNDNNQTFIIFFDMPDPEELSIRHKDIEYITINDADYPVSIAADGSFTFEGTRFSDTPKATYSMIDSKDFANSTRSVYFETEDAFFMGEKSYTLGLKDKAGLIQTVYVNTEISRLSRPEIKDIDGVIYTTGANEMVAGSDIDPYKLTMTPPSTDHKGNNVGETTLHYALYKGTSTVSALIEEDESVNPITISLTEGTYYLETYATKLNYEQSALTTVTLRVVDSAIYVDENGDDQTADGTRELPFKTLQAAIADVDQRNMPDAKLNIYIAGTLVETAIVNPTIGDELTISGRPGATAVLDANGNGPALTIDTTVPVTIKNITIKNGNAENGGAVLMKNGTKLTLAKGTVLTENTATNNGGAVYVPAGASLEITNGVSITHNTAGQNGGGIYTTTNLTLSGAIQISDNTNTSDEKSNLYIPTGIILKITDSLSDNGNNSNIGITTQSIPTILTPITITQGYGFNGGNNDGVVPGTYFTGDHYAASFDEVTGEAVIAVNGGSISDVISTQEITFALEDATPSDGVLWFEAGAADAAARTLKVIPTIMIAGTDVTAEALASTSNPVIWNIELFINGIPVPDCTFTTLEFAVPQSIDYQDIYTLHVQATYNGMSYDDEFTVYGYDPS